MTFQDILEEAQSLPLAERRELIKRLVDTLTIEDSEITDPPSHQHSILELRGLGKEIWQGIDAQQYLNDMRDEWDQHP